MHSGYIQRRTKHPGNETMGGRENMKLRKKLWRARTKGRSKNVWQNLASVGKALLQLVFKFCIDSFKWPMRWRQLFQSPERPGTHSYLRLPLASISAGSEISCSADHDRSWKWGQWGSQRRLLLCPDSLGPVYCNTGRRGLACARGERFSPKAMVQKNGENSYCSPTLIGKTFRAWTQRSAWGSFLPVLSQAMCAAWPCAYHR